MTVAPGTRLGPYEVTAQIGEGGMGQVFRARDTKLDRDVAIKILPGAFAQDSDRVARFSREAKTLASLNHPHIAGIYGLEESAGVTALVMELVEGDDLSQRIARGAIPLDEALPLARQIAEALESAHGHGIIHRDLKPANIKVRSDGTVKVLDFGLAKAMDPPASAPGVTQSPTITSPAMTQAGTILGTAAYMAPEQARGKAVDKRADIWAFACVLYEMLTGQRAFKGEDITDTIVSVVSREPDWTLLPGGLSPALAIYLRRCLHKDPKQRIPDIAAVRLALDGAFDTTAPVMTATPPPERRRLAWMAVSGAAVLATATLVLQAIGGWTRPPAPGGGEVMRFGMAFARNLGGGTNRHVAISPDGHTIALSGLGQIHRRSLNSLEEVPIRGTESGAIAAFSPDGLSIAFVEGSQLKRVAIDGGAAVPLCPIDESSVAGVAWQGSQILFADTARGVFAIPDTGGTPTLLMPADAAAGEVIHGPHLLPDGRSLLFTSRPSDATRWDDAHVMLYSLDTQTRRTLVRGGTDGRYLTAGYLVFVREGTIYAQAFDPTRSEVSGTPIAVVDGVQRTGAQDSGVAQFDVSNTGTLVYQPAAPPRSLVWRTRDGRETQIGSEAKAFVRPRVSPDGTKVAVADETQGDLWLLDIGPETMTRLTTDGTGGVASVWTPDSRRLIFSNAKGVFSIRLDSPGVVEQMAAAGAGTVASITPDGRHILTQVGPGIGIVDLADRSFRMLIAEPGVQAGPQVSPDGRWLAYYSGDAGAVEVSVRPFPDVNGQRWRVSRDGGSNPVWSAAGQELFYMSGGQIISAGVATSPSFALRSSMRLFGAPIPTPIVGRQFDPMPDGSRVVALRYVASQGASVHVVVNWFKELQLKLSAR